MPEPSHFDKKETIPVKSPESDTPKETPVDIKGLPTVDQLVKYETLSPGMSDRILSIIERQAEVNLEKIGLKRQQSLMTAVISGALVTLAGVGILFDVFWPVVLVLGLSGMATFVLRELVGRLGE